MHSIFEKDKQWEGYRELNSRKSSKDRQDDNFLIGLNQEVIYNTQVWDFVWLHKTTSTTYILSLSNSERVACKNLLK